MSDPVDLTNLRSMTDGDVDMELVLFEEFYRTFDEGIAALQGFMQPEHQEQWRKQAHALKGVAVNLGAAALGAICKQAQEQHTAEAATKTAILRDIETHYATAREFLIRMALI